jgi:hypothetical protein
MDSVPSGLILTVLFVALVGLAAQTALLKQLVDNANVAIKKLEERLASLPERP